MKTNIQSIEGILDKMMNAVDESKTEIFSIGEDSREEFEALKKELTLIQQRINYLIDKAEKTSLQSKFSRRRLAEVSRDFAKYSDDQVKKAYEQANEFQIQLVRMEQEEKRLRERRDQIERRIKKLEDTILRSDQLVTQINAVMDYLRSDLQEVSNFVQGAAEMHSFGVKIIQAQEEERKKLSREIHDGPAQMMANVMLRSELVERVLKKHGAEKAMQEIQDLRLMVKESLSEVRRIIYDLRPMSLDDLGLIPTINKYLITVEERTKANILFTPIGKEIRLPSHIEVAVFRFVQEAVQNAVKHARANQIRVKIEICKDFIAAMIKDDGKGFNTNEKKEGSFGLIGMRERVQMLEGTLTINSKPGKGTLVMMQLPLIEAD